MDKNKILRQLPKVDRLLGETEGAELCRQYGKERTTEAFREALDALRNQILHREEGLEKLLQNTKKTKPEVFQAWIFDRSRTRLRESDTPSFQRVLNATGVILHTNLGRAPMGEHQRAAVLEAMWGYSNLEYELSEGKRGRRQCHYKDLICQITRAEDAVAVNNNAAAVSLILGAMAEKKEVVVSRGELIEIGGRFRVPDVMEQSGAILRETGCTNRTRISDYEKVLREETAALLKVHTSNYKIVGFTEETSVKELAQLGEKHGIPVIVDLGSGVLVNLEKYGLAHEPTVQEVLKQGADVVCFSGDKLLGGPQAGIIAGKKKYIKAIEKHPMMRMLRLDKFTTAALEATFREYLDEKNAWENIPVLQMIARSEDELRLQAEEIIGELGEWVYPGRITLEKSLSAVGGGSLPGEEMPDYAVVIEPKEESAEELSCRLRKLPVPVIAHIKNEKVWLEMRTISAKETSLLIKALKEALFH